ncbi:hypothetical protein IMZ48_40670 [Candidatus Bathyarchaeota archaeon]|nr:hypothetical protein [Candidatus Bathyarchaeota archaeon]
MNRHTYTDDEKKAYIDAELCLMDKEATLGLSVAKNRFEELQAVHILHAEITHNVVRLQNPTMKASAH